MLIDSLLIAILADAGVCFAKIATVDFPVETGGKCADFQSMGGTQVTVMILAWMIDFSINTAFYHTGMTGAVVIRDVCFV